MAFDLRAIQERMLSEDFNRKVDAKAKSYASTGGAVSTPSVNSTVPAAPRYTPQPQVTATVQESSKLPKAILESFRKQPSMSGLEEMPSVVGAEIERLGLTEDYSAKKKDSQQQTVAVTQPAYTPAPSNGIDYGVIKSIVDSAVNDLKKELLSGTTLKAFRIGNGNKVQFLDSKGNVFEGTLTLKKRKP